MIQRRPIIRTTNLLSNAGACETKLTSTLKNWMEILCIIAGRYQHLESLPSYNKAYGYRD